MKPSVEFYYTLDHSCHRTNIKPCGVFVTSVGFLINVTASPGLTSVIKTDKNPLQATGETPTARRKKKLRQMW